MVCTATVEVYYFSQHHFFMMYYSILITEVHAPPKAVVNEIKREKIVSLKPLSTNGVNWLYWAITTHSKFTTVQCASFGHLEFQNHH